MLSLDTPVELVKGIGPRLAETLQKKDIRTVEDLLYHLPFRYEDRVNPRAFNELKAGEMASVIGEVRGSMLLRTRGKPIFEMTVGQGLETLKCLWFGGAYLKDKFQPGQAIALFGRVEPSRSSRGFKMIQPHFELLAESGGPEEGEASGTLEVGRITPVYPTLGGPKLGGRWLRRLIFELLGEVQGRVPETVPVELLRRLELPSREEALRCAHFPEVGTSMLQLAERSTPAYRRLIFEELFYLELGLELKRRKAKERVGIGFETNEAVRAAVREVLPFHPTPAQKRALGEIIADMRAASPMRRLLQGDVGSGKTIVALQAMLVAVGNGFQAALMAPTEILATQHYLSARELLERASREYRIVLLTGSLDEDRKRANRGKIARGEAELIIGTHALIEDKVEFDRLGLVVVDEQHRFGVMQRFRLMKKPGLGEPDVLVMTATPIPRTLAMTLYGDLDVSVLDELPPGRTPIVTRRVGEDRAAEVWEFVRRQVKRGYQAFIVYPVIEGRKEEEPELDFAAENGIGEAARGGRAERESPRKKGSGVAQQESPTLFEREPLKSATEMYGVLRAGPLAGLRVGLLHGRLGADDKEIVMRRFQRGEIDVLVCTTVIEVGVDVPNATLMVVEHAERFGMAQLHQLRGRVGRGAGKSYCVLMTSGNVSPEAEERLAAMVRTQNGFELAELDLKQRGPGEFFGTRQAGLPDFRVADLMRDRELLDLAKAEAAHFVATAGAEASTEERVIVATRLKQAWQRRYGLVEAG